MSTFCHLLQDVLDQHKERMPDGAYQQLAELVSDESQRGLKLVTYSLAEWGLDGEMSIEVFSVVCRPATSNFCLNHLMKRGEYDPDWLEAESPVTDVMGRCAYTLISVDDLAPMHKRRRASTQEKK